MPKRGYKLTGEQRSIADEIIKLAKQKGWEVDYVRVKMLYTKEVGEFVGKIEQAHRNAERSQLVYKCQERAA